MKRITRLYVTVAAIVCCILTNASAQQTVTIHFTNKVGDKNLHLSTEIYENNFGEIFTVNKFKYYISKIVLVISLNIIMSKSNARDIM